MKIKLANVSDWYSRTTYYSGTVEIQTSNKIDNNISEETIENIDITIIKMQDDNLGSQIDVTLIDDLPDGVNEEEFKQEVIKQFQNF